MAKLHKKIQIEEILKRSSARAFSRENATLRYFSEIQDTNLVVIVPLYDKEVVQAHKLASFDLSIGEYRRSSVDMNLFLQI